VVVDLFQLFGLFAHP